MWDAQRGITVGRSSAAGRVVTTESAGDRWRPSFPNTFAGPLQDVSLLDRGFAFAGGFQRTIIKSSDYGRTWTDHSAAMPTVPVSTRDIFGIDFVSEQKGWAVGGFEGTILHTDDGGQTWNHQITPSQGFIVLSIDMFDDQLGLAGGTGDALWRTQDGGQSWNLILIPAVVPGETNITAIEFASNQVAWITGEFGFVARSDDGGLTWIRQDTGVPLSGGPGVFNTIGDIHVISEQEGYATWNVNDTILHTTDAGQT